MSAWSPRPEGAITQPRLLIGLCLDVSRSMAGPTLAALNQGVTDLFDAVEQDPYARHSAEIGLVAFAGKAVLVQPFTPFTSGRRPPRLTVRLEGLLLSGKELPGGTNLGAALRLTLDAMAQREKECSRLGLQLFRSSMLVILTDGYRITDDLEPARTRLRKLEESCLEVHPFGVGAHVDVAAIDGLSAKNRASLLTEADLAALFVWLSRSVRSLSRSEELGAHGFGPG